MERVRERWVKRCTERCTGKFFLCLPMRNGCCLMVWYHMIMSLLAAMCGVTDFRVAAINNYVPIMAINSSIAFLYHVTAALTEFTLGSAILVAFIAMKDPFLYLYILLVLLWAMVAVTFAVLEATRMLPDRNYGLKNHDIANIVVSCINAVIACYFAWAALLQTYLLKEARDKRDREMQLFLEELNKIRRKNGLPDLTPSDLKLLQRESFLPGRIESDSNILSQHVSVHADEDLEQDESRSENKSLQGSGRSDIRSLSNLLGHMDDKQEVERKTSGVTYGELYPDIMTAGDETGKTTLRTACGKCRVPMSERRDEQMVTRFEAHLKEHARQQAERNRVQQRLSVISSSHNGSGRSETLEGRIQGSPITIKSTSDTSRGSELKPVDTEENQQSRARPPNRHLSNLLGHMYEEQEVGRITSAGAREEEERQVATVYPEEKKGDVMAASSSLPRGSLTSKTEKANNTEEKNHTRETT